MSKKILLYERKLAYVTGPFNSGPLTAAENLANAKLMTRYAWKAGFIPVNPITNFVDWEKYVGDGTMTERQILYSCLRLLKVCEVVLMSPLANTSTGALIEEMVGRAWNKKVYYASVGQVYTMTGETYMMVPSTTPGVIREVQGALHQTGRQSTVRRSDRPAGQHIDIR